MARLVIRIKFFMLVCAYGGAKFILMMGFIVQQTGTMEIILHFRMNC